MDQKVLVKNLKRLLRELQRHHGPVALLMLSPVGDAWSIVASARKLDALSQAQAIGLLFDLVRDTMSEEVWRMIIQVTVLRTDDPFVLTLTSMFPAKKSAVDLFECTIAGIEIPRAIVIRAEKLAA